MGGARFLHDPDDVRDLRMTESDMDPLDPDPTVEDLEAMPAPVGAIWVCQADDVGLPVNPCGPDSPHGPLCRWESPAPPVEDDGRMVVVGLELPEVQRCRCCGDTQRADGRTLCQACLDHNCNAGGLCYLPLGTVVS